MSQFGGVERPGPWETAGDHERRIRALEATPCCIDNPDAPTLSDLILANPCLAAFWKLNESTGDVAADSGPGSYDADSGAGTPPEWAEATTSYGEPSPQFGAGDLLENTSFPGLSDDLTLEIFGFRDAGGGANMISQGNPYPANSSGIALGWIGEGLPLVYYGRAVIGDSTGGPHIIEQATFDPDGDWHHFVVTREGAIWTFYIDTVVIGTFDDGGTNYTATTGIQIGNISGSLSAFMFPGNLSYGAAYTCALTAEEIAEHYAASVSLPTVTDGWVITADSTSPTGWSWQPPSIEVEF